VKAIIMAGGEGSRLRPLTCNRPKPMVPVLNRPVMAYCLDLLKQHGISEIGVTLQYLPQAIQDYFGDGSDFGVRLHYFVEETPLGTAGSVKNAAAFLDETFVVVSGDALTDLDLSQAIAFHRNRGAAGTLVLTRVDCPLEYGVVITAPEGQIVQFLEKPSWSEVFSDTVNTGIYVLEPEVLDYFAPGQKFDFSQDLFPLLLREKKPLFGLVLSGYWCDIGIAQSDIAQHILDYLDSALKIVVSRWSSVVGLLVGIHISEFLAGPFSSSGGVTRQGRHERLLKKAVLPLTFRQVYGGYPVWWWVGSVNHSTGLPPIGVHPNIPR